jgi:hypothetical protein
MTEEHRRMPSFADADDLVDLRTGDEQIKLAPGEDMRDFLEKIVSSPRQPMQRRVKCAEILMSYKYPKFGAVAIGSISGRDFASMLERAIRNSGKEREVKQIEARAIASSTSTDEGAG